MGRKDRYLVGLDVGTSKVCAINVRSLRKSFVAIPWLDRPSAIAAITSPSRSVKPSSGSEWRTCASRCFVGHVRHEKLTLDHFEQAVRGRDVALFRHLRQADGRLLRALRPVG